MRSIPTVPSSGRPSAQEVLEQLGALGVARVAQVVEHAGWVDGEWVCFAALLDDVDARVRALGDQLGGPRPALAASLLARSLLPLVVTPTAVSWSVFRAIPDLGASNLLVGFVDDRPAVVSMREPRLVEVTAGRWADEVIDGVCGALIEALRRVVTVGSRHLWGNVALAVAAPFAALLAEGRHDGRRDRDLLLAQRRGLAQTVEILDVSTEQRHLEAVRRRTCCLLTKLPEPHRTMCGTCSLRPRSEQLVRLHHHYADIAAEADLLRNDRSP
jgi:ferric iron reductase protein FhuF